MFAKLQYSQNPGTARYLEKLMRGFRLLQNHAEIASAKSKALLQVSRNRDMVSVTRHAEVLAVNPEVSGAIIHLENAVAQRAKAL